MTRPSFPACSTDPLADAITGGFTLTDEQLNRFIGIPFKDGGESFDGCDCYGLVRLFYRTVLNVNLPAYPYAAALDELRIERWIAFGKTIHNWKKNAGSIPGDVVLFNVKGRTCHCGVIVHDDYFLHCMKGVASCLEQLSNPIWQQRIEGFYQWCQE